MRTVLLLNKTIIVAAIVRMVVYDSD